MKVTDFPGAYFDRQNRVMIVALSVLVILVLGRYAVGGFDFSYFIVAGSDFADASQMEHSIIIQPGQGYDGQFFYKYALNPFDHSPSRYGINVDLPPYRGIRIGYPFLVWVASVGGKPSLVPLMMVVVNMLLFVGLIYFTSKIVEHFSAPAILKFMPLLLSGLYMSLARDLSEISELFFFLGSFYFLTRSKFFKAAAFAFAALMSRETVMVALFPLFAIYLAQAAYNRTFKVHSILLVIPFLLFAMWKYYVTVHTSSAELVPASGNLSFPFNGILEGLNFNLDLSSFKNIMQFFFWILFFTWQIIFTVIVCKVVVGGNFKENMWILPLAGVYFCWMGLAACLSVSVYIDDWSFVRVLSLWNMTGMLLLITRKRRPGRLFVMFSAFIVILLIGRLIIRV